MKAILEFTLPKDDRDFYNAINGNKLNIILWSYNIWLNEKINQTNSKELIECKEQLNKIILEQNINLE